MFVVTKSWGQYSEKGCSSVCVCETEQDAEKAILLLEEIEKFNKEESKILFDKTKVYRETLGYKEVPNTPHKFNIDPHKLISEKDWVKNYIIPFQLKSSEATSHNRELDVFVRAFVGNNKPMIPDKFLIFSEEIAVNENQYHNSYDYGIEEVPMVKL